MTPLAHSAARPGPRAVPLALDEDVRFLKGVGPHRADLLACLGIQTIRDLIHYLPAKHERYGPTVTIEDLQPDQTQSVICMVLSVKGVGFGRSGRIKAVLGDNSGRMHCTWFSAPWMLEKLRPGAWVRVRGRMRLYADWPSMVNPETEVIDGPIPTVAGREQGLIPIYRVCEGLTSRQVAQLIRRAWEGASPQIQEWYDAPWRQRRKLLPRRLALQRLHWPDDPTQLAEARRRLAYDELLLLQLAVAIRRWHIREARPAPAMPLSDEIDRRIRRRFPFTFTSAQDRAVREIAADMARPVAMNRLLEGDVGSGKTAVALYGSLLAIARRWQVAILAPTEILAEQHYARISQYLAGSRVRHGLLTGSTSQPVRRRLLKAAAAGELDLLAGTHALLEGDVSFAKLGLVIVDEQHRFGVRQRAVLRGKGRAPHYLVMTATPIPRTLAMTLFGDLDVSVIDQMPPGRQPVRTRLFSEADEPAAFQFVRARIDASEQAFVVYPLINESQDLPLKAAADEFDRLRKSYFSNIPVGLLHGRMPSTDRQKVMDAFVAGRLKVLVSTTVIEVGIDVPRATVMLVQHAERYGLAQIHQLRGRVGRRDLPGYCLLVADTGSEQAMERLRVLAGTTDGFAVAEADLRLRGPGELIGLRQHGLPEVEVADLSKDLALLMEAREDAQSIIRDDPRLARPALATIRAHLARRTGQIVSLIDLA
jgi:ATP-dependent DNA helicase RecG